MMDTTKCALCGGDNGCGVAAGKTECWCFALPVPPALLERVPEALRNATCVCQQCVLGYLDQQQRNHESGRQQPA